MKKNIQYCNGIEIHPYQQSIQHMLIMHNRNNHLDPDLKIIAIPPISTIQNVLQPSLVSSYLLSHCPLFLCVFTNNPARVYMYVVKIQQPLHPHSMLQQLPPPRLHHPSRSDYKSLPSEHYIVKVVIVVSTLITIIPSNTSYHLIWQYIILVHTTSHIFHNLWVEDHTKTDQHLYMICYEDILQLTGRKLCRNMHV